ncbi:hypothetical protein ACSQ67_005286 [Phaseolus vulgaris]
MAATEHGISVDSERTNLLNHHTEKHFTAGEIVRDIIIGVSDGLTVPFALAAGLSGANATSSIVLTAGIAEVAAGAISMGLGGYLAAKSEADNYSRELKREQEEIIAVPETEAAEVAEILAEYGIQPHEYAPVVNALRKNPQAWLDFMMKSSRQNLVTLEMLGCNLEQLWEGDQVYVHKKVLHRNAIAGPFMSTRKFCTEINRE